MMRDDNGGEASMLLSAYQQAAIRDVHYRIAQRRRSVRSMLWIVTAITLLVGCVVAIDKFAMLNAVASTNLDTQVGTGDQPMAMESQFGWSSIGGGWCSLRCMFSSDKQKCEESVGCNKPDGSGGGSGSMGANVGDPDDKDKNYKNQTNSQPTHPANGQHEYTNANANANIDTDYGET